MKYGLFCWKYYIYINSYWSYLSFGWYVSLIFSNDYYLFFLNFWFLSIGQLVFIINRRIPALSILYYYGRTYILFFINILFMVKQPDRAAPGGPNLCIIMPIYRYQQIRKYKAFDQYSYILRFDSYSNRVFYQHIKIG